MILICNNDFSSNNTNNSCVNTILEHYKHDNELIDLYLNSEKNNLIVKEHILIYIAGYVQKKLIQRTKCGECYDFLSKQTNKISCPIIDLKNYSHCYSGLQKPIDYINFIVQECEKILITYTEKFNLFIQKDIMLRLLHATQKIILDKKPNFLSALDEHMSDSSHRIKMIRNISEFFYSLRLKHMSKEKNCSVSPKHIRQIMTKLIIFNGD